MATAYKKIFKKKLLGTIKMIPGEIVLREDVKSLASEREVSRALKALVQDGELVKLGYGIYAKAEPSTLLNRPIIRGGFTGACVELLNRLGIDWEPSQAVKDYNEGRSQQVPARFEVRLKSRFRRKISYNNRRLCVEEDIYAK